jgi:predicted ATP-grasp superfamily ATP-dependent carboligase
MKVFLTNADHKNALAALRSLSKRNIFVGLSGLGRWDHAFFSRYVKQKFIHVSPEKSPELFFNQLTDFLTKNKYDVFLPIGIDIATIVALHHKEITELISVPFPDYSIYEKAHDKAITLEIAEKIGIPIPKTYYPKNLDEYTELLPNLDFPHVLKTSRGSGSSGVTVVDKISQAKDKYKELTSRKTGYKLIYDYEKPMVQEYMPGEIHDVCALTDNGETKVALTQKRLKMWPARGGAGIVNITTDWPELIEMADKLLAKIKYHGVSVVEFKLDVEGQPRLMEINPKFWGTLDLSIKAGFDFPYLACKLALGQEITQDSGYKVGLTYRWIMPYELMHLFSTGKGLLSFLNFSGNQTYDLNLDDPFPEFFRLPNMLSKYLQRKGILK